MAQLAARHSDLAEPFAILRQRLGDAEWPNRRGLVAQWDDLLDEIRTRPGLDRFLCAPEPADLAAAVGDGLLVAVNVAPERCDAIIVGPGRVEALSLPSLTWRDAYERAAAFLAVVQVDDPEGDRVVTLTLDWLWETVVKPVLGRLGRMGTGDPPPRLTWMPTGPLSVLPLTAVGLDDVVPSVTATVAALGSAHWHSPGQVEDAVVVGPSESASVTEAAKALAALTRQTSILAGVTADTPLDALGGRSIVHFGGPAQADLPIPAAVAWWWPTVC